MVTKNDRFTALFTVGYLCLCLIPHFCDAQADTEYCGNSLVRLVGGSDISEGRVEVCRENRWGTVCNNSWDDNDARVVCRQLGLPTSGATASNAHFGEGSADIIWLDDVQCDGSESRLGDCFARGFVSNDCQHSKDAGVKCIYESNSLPVASVVGGAVGGGILLVCFTAISLSLVYGLKHRRQRRAAQARHVQKTQAQITNSSATVTKVTPSSNQADSGSSSKTCNSSSMPEHQIDGTQFGVPRMENPPSYSEMDPLINEKPKKDEELTELPPCSKVEAGEMVV